MIDDKKKNKYFLATLDRLLWEANHELSVIFEGVDRAQIEINEDIMGRLKHIEAVIASAGTEIDIKINGEPS